jgi:acyl-coenzyme A synthetase/AMP-(fatty) acid ligase
MTVSPPEARTARSLRQRIAMALDGRAGPALIGPKRQLPLATLAQGRLTEGAPADLAGRAVLLRTHDPLAAAAGLAATDGLARRVVLCPPDIGGAALAEAARLAACDLVFADQPDAADLPELPRVRLDLEGSAAPASQPSSRPTEWALFTSGTSGAPKLVSHTLEGLSGAIAPRPPGEPQPVWATFYDIRRYGGLQMLLRALLGGFDLHVTDGREPLPAFLERLKAAGATHVAGTPSHWRRALMSPALHGLEPLYVRLSGEIADQAVLDALRARFPHARLGHAYASTEAGVGFEVTDGREGFPAALLERTDGPVGMRIADGVLQLRSARVAHGYLGEGAPRLQDPDGWVDTGDLVERRADRVHFLGRASGIINVGGLKVSPEEVEAVINRCPQVRMSRVAARTSPLLGSLVAAEVVLENAADPVLARADILDHCRAELPPHKVPASLRLVDALPVSASGKLERRRA